MYVEPIISEKIKHYRTLHAMTQRELAEVAGVEPLHIYNIEHGKKGISLDKLMLICQHFHINLSDILPIEERDDSELRSRWKDELMDALDRLDTYQLRMVNTMVGSLLSE